MQKVITSFLISFVLLTVVIILSRRSYENGQKFSKDAEHSRNVIQQYSSIDIQLRSAEGFAPEYEKSIAKDLFLLYKEDLSKLELSIKLLKTHVKGDSQQTAIADSIEKTVQRQIPTLRLKNMTDIIRSGEEQPIKELLKAHELIRKGIALEEITLAQNRSELIKANSSNNVLTYVLAVVAFLIISVTFLQQFFLRRKSMWLEGFLESILNTTQNGVVYYRAVRKENKIVDFKMEYANQAIESLLGIDPKKIIGKKLTQIDSYILKTDIFSKFKEVVDKAEPVQFEHFYKYHGIERWLHLSITKLHDGITVAFHNISDIKRYEEDLKKNITQLEQTNLELEEYAYAASHDLQEPLRKIRTFGGFLQDTQYEKLDEKGRLHIDKILQSTERMSLLIKDLLSYSSLKQKEEFVPTDLNEILENVLQDLEMIIAQKKAIISHDALPEIDAIPVQINQLFYNLVNNALKFSKDDLPLHLDISCRTVNSSEIKDVPGLQPATPYYEIIFSDNGIGFNQTYAHQIFGLFKRLNDKSSYAGSGIGLSLCKKVVTNHGGVISANGKEGVGAQFYIYLPVPIKPAVVAPPALL